jgi:DNA-binding transcriptional ArsR family regulator
MQMLADDRPDSCTTLGVDRSKLDAVDLLVDDAEVGQLAALFRMLGDPTRTRILCALVEAGELCVCEISEVVSSPESTVSHALRLLRTAGVVRNRREGRTIHYRLDDDHVRLLLQLSLAHLRHDTTEASS